MIVKGSDHGDFQRPDPGTYVARCVRIIDLGTQTGEYQGKPTIRRQVMLGWELPTELIPTGEAEGQPFFVTKFYTASLAESATLRKDLANWRSRDFTEEEIEGFDLANILGKGCLLTVTTNENKRTKVTSVTSLPKGTQVPEQINPSVNFDLDAFDPDVYAGLSEWFRETIAQSPEYQAAITGKPAPTFDGDDIPF